MPLVGDKFIGTSGNDRGSSRERDPRCIGTGGGENGGMREVMLDHQRRYPEWRVEDLYKLVHQAAMGSEHAVIDEERARAWLVRELREMGPGPSEPLVDPIAADGSIVRVHLRPYVGRGLDPEDLLAAFVRTAREVRGSTARIEEALAVATQLACEKAIPFGENDIACLLARIRAARFPAVHHSAQFVALYRPAYRVVASDVLSDHSGLSRPGASGDERSP